MEKIWRIFHTINNFCCILKKEELKQVESIFPNGDQYKGNMLGELREGVGWYFYHNGDIYYGEWKKNKKEGFGLFYYSNENQYYQGFWKNN